jgi:histidine ammonia-lyase
MERFDWQPIVLQSKKDGFTNGTQFMSAYGTIHILMKANKFSYLADLIRYPWKHLTVASSHLMS